MTRTDIGPIVGSVLLGEAAENGPFALFVHDEHGRIVAVNDAACRLTGYGRDELLSTAAPLLNVDPAEGVRIMAGIHEGRVAGGRTTIVCRDGRELEIEYRGGLTRTAGLPYLLVAAWVVE